MEIISIISFICGIAITLGFRLIINKAQSNISKTIYVVRSLAAVPEVVGLLGIGANKEAVKLCVEAKVVGRDTKYLLLVEGPDHIAKDLSDWLQTNDEFFVTTSPIHIIRIENGEDN